MTENGAFQQMRRDRSCTLLEEGAVSVGIYSPSDKKWKIPWRKCLQTAFSHAQFQISYLKTYG